MKKIIEALTPKKIFFDAIADKLKDTDITKINLIFVLETEKYNVMLSTAEGKNMKLDITYEEITTIKKLFIRRIVAKWNENYSIEPRTVIVEVDIIKKDLNIFIEDKKGIVSKFDF